MGAIAIICSYGSKKTSPVRTIEIESAIYEHVFICNDCDLTMVFRMTQILSARNDPNCLT